MPTERRIECVGGPHDGETRYDGWWDPDGLHHVGSVQRVRLWSGSYTRRAWRGGEVLWWEPIASAG